MSNVKLLTDIPQMTGKSFILIRYPMSILYYFEASPSSLVLRMISVSKFQANLIEGTLWWGFDIPGGVVVAPKENKMKNTGSTLMVLPCLIASLSNHQMLLFSFVYLPFSDIISPLNLRTFSCLYNNTRVPVAYFHLPSFTSSSSNMTHPNLISILLLDQCRL